MDAIRKLEHRKFLLTALILVISLSTLVVTSWRTPYALDSFWHLQMAKDWIENGLSPWIDHYSFTYNGHEIVNPPVIFQSLLYLLTSQLGVETGFQAYRLLGFTLAIGTAALVLRQIRAPAVIYALVIPMIVLLLQLRALVRPELLSYTFSLIALSLYFRAGDRISTRNVLPMVALMWIWSIYHSSIVGYVIFFGFFLDCAIAQWKSRDPVAVWTKWLGWGLLIVAVGYLNPGFSHPLIDAITFPEGWKVFIREYLPTNSGPLAGGIYVLTLIALLTPLMALKQRRFGFVVIWAVLFYAAVTMNRMVTPAGIVIMILAASLLVDNSVLQRAGPAFKGYLNGLVWLALAVAISVILYSNVKGARHFLNEPQALFGRFPVAAVDYMEDRKLSGRILNEYSVGGYLIHRLAHQNQVYIDGRTQILYPLEHMAKYKSLTRTTNPVPLKGELDKYAVDQIFWRHSQLSHDMVDDIGGYGLDFLDVSYVLYTRENPNFPLVGRLLAKPECWRTGMLEGLRAERRRMDEVLPAYSRLFPVADFFIGYSEAEDGKAFVDANFDGKTWFDEMRRFAGFRLLESGEYYPVVALFGGVEVRKPRDYLVRAFVMIQVGEYAVATQIIEDFTNISWSYVRLEDSFILLKLYQAIEQSRELTPIEQARVQDLGNLLTGSGFTGLGPENPFDNRSFCNFPDQPD